MSCKPSQLTRFGIKLFLAEPTGLDLADLVPIFHRWIQSAAVGGLLIDVADYRHVPDGPGVILIGHEADYSLDRTEGPLGLLYNRKRPGTGSSLGRLYSALHAALTACRTLERETAFNERDLKFRGETLRLIVNDRLVAGSCADLHADLEEVSKVLYPGRPFRIRSSGSDPRDRLGIEMETGEGVDVGTLLERLSARTLRATRDTGPRRRAARG